MEKQEKTVAVICEYNPFHFGHKYQIEYLKGKYSTVFGIMSGEFVQRGEVAVTDKYSRAAAALCGGMDAVLELPFPYCVASAADFAAAGVHIAAKCGADALAFGCEDEGALLLDIARLAAHGGLGARTDELIKARPNLSYPKARTIAIGEVLGAEAAAALSKPNNILAVEYIKTVLENDYPLELCFVRRNFSYQSASDIRAEDEYTRYIPYPKYFPDTARGLKYAERWLIGTLRADVPEGLYCIDKPLAATLRSAAKAAESLEALVNTACGKVYTAARVRRAVIAAWLRISPDAVKAKPAYTCLLAANEQGQAFLRRNKKSGAFPIITKPAAYKKLEASARFAYEAALRAEEAAAICTERLLPYSSPLAKTPLIIQRPI